MMTPKGFANGACQTEPQNLEIFKKNPECLLCEGYQSTHTYSTHLITEKLLVVDTLTKLSDTVLDQQLLLGAGTALTIFGIF